MTAGGGRRDRLKRRADENDAHGHAGSIRKKRNSSALAVHGKERLRDSVSIRELAKPYLLAVGRLPIDVLDTRWSAGRNRTIEPVHVRELREAFRTNGLERREPRNRLLCLCSADAVRRARESARESAPTDRQSSGSDDEIEMLNWAEVNSGLVEVMAGQHRIAALREYVRDSGSQADELWWTCELYDQGVFPPRLPADYTACSFYSHYLRSTIIYMTCNQDERPDEIGGLIFGCCRSSAAASCHADAAKPNGPYDAGQPWTDMDAVGINRRE